MEKTGNWEKLERAIYFDMDGTIANLYGVANWLEQLQAEEAAPYRAAAPLLKLQPLARRLNQLQRAGFKLGIVSWLSKNSNKEYDEKVTKAKKEWLNIHLKSIQWDEIHIIKYGTPKEKVVNYPNGILFDDEEENRKSWKGKSFSEKEIMEILRSVA